MTTTLIPRSRVEKFSEHAERAVAWRSFLDSSDVPQGCDDAVSVAAATDAGRLRIECWANRFQVALDSYELILLDRSRLEMFEPRRLYLLVIEAHQIVRIIEARLRDCL